MSVFHISKEYHDALEKTQPKTFLKKLGRVYIFISGVKYKGEKITVAVPLRANINKWQQKRGEYLPTLPTPHTNDGNVAGWHFIKMIPHANGLFYKNNKEILLQEISLAEQIAKSVMPTVKQNVQTVLNRFENNDKIDGAVKFNLALREMKKIEESFAEQKLIKKYSLTKEQMNKIKITQEKISKHNGEKYTLESLCRASAGIPNRPKQHQKIQEKTVAKPIARKQKPTPKPDNNKPNKPKYKGK
jgi:hypothetical protein